MGIYGGCWFRPPPRHYTPAGAFSFETGIVPSLDLKIEITVSPAADIDRRARLPYLQCRIWNVCSSTGVNGLPKCGHWECGNRKTSPLRFPRLQGHTERYHLRKDTAHRDAQGLSEKGEGVSRLSGADGFNRLLTLHPYPEVQHPSEAAEKTSPATSSGEDPAKRRDVGGVICSVSQIGRHDEVYDSSREPCSIRERKRSDYRVRGATERALEQLTVLSIIIRYLFSFKELLVSVIVSSVLFTEFSNV